MRRTVLLVLWVLAGAPIPAIADAAPDTDIAGLYSCEGMSPEGHPYRGQVEIVRLDDTYRIMWSLESDGGALRVIGVGILSNGVFAVSYFGGAPGIAVYKPDGAKLVGQWTVGGADGVLYPETLTRLADQQRREAPPQEPRRPARRPASVRPAIAALR